jgi:glycine betaine/choline ABC-type transport system substrate-binding protein
MIGIGKHHRAFPASLLALSALLAVSLLLGGCEDDFKRVRIGSQDFTEQKILAEMMALLAEQAGVSVEARRNKH